MHTHHVELQHCPYLQYSTSIFYLSPTDFFFQYVQIIMSFFQCGSVDVDFQCLSISLFISADNMYHVIYFETNKLMDSSLIPAPIHLITKVLHQTKSSDFQKAWINDSVISQL